MDAEKQPDGTLKLTSTLTEQEAVELRDRLVADYPVTPPESPQEPPVEPPPPEPVPEPTPVPEPVTPPVVVGPRPVEIRTLAELSPAIRAGALEVHLRGGDYGQWIHKDDTSRSVNATVEAYPSEPVTMRGALLQNVRRVRFGEGIRSTGRIETSRGSRFIEWAGSPGRPAELTAQFNFQKSGQNDATDSCTDLLCEHFWLHDSAWRQDPITGAGSGGYGFQSSTNRTERLTLRHGVVERCERDGIQLASSAFDVLIEDVILRHIKAKPPPPGTAPGHADAMQVITSGRNLTFRNCQVWDCAHPARVTPSSWNHPTGTFLNVIYENCLFVRVNNVPLQLGAGVTGELRHCTVVDCALPPTIQGQVLVRNNLWVTAGGRTGNGNVIAGKDVFVDPAGDDFRLRAPLPVPSVGVAEDLDYGPRPSSPSAGCYEPV